MIKTALIGYGSMGKEIEALAKDSELKITEIFDENQPLTEKSNFNFDVAIEFSTPNTVLSNIEILAKKRKNIVLGTTGWYDKMDYVKDITEKFGIGLVWGSNFSIGMQMYLQIIDKAARLVNNFDEYDVMAHEMHHKRKMDSPSGTAETLAEILLREINRKQSIQTETAHSQIKPEELHITSTRGGEIFGTHTVYLDSLADTIEITHRARNRKGFALGAIKAAKYIYNKKGFYNFTKIFNTIL